MLDRAHFAALLIPLSLASCTGGSETKEAFPSSSAAPGGATPPPGVEPPAVGTGAAQQPPRPPAAPAVTTPKPAGSTPDAGVPPDAGKSDAATPDAATPDAGADSGSIVKAKACADKCQGVLQSCLTPSFPKDGGLPQLKDPAACQAAFDTCRVACTP